MNTLALILAASASGEGLLKNLFVLLVICAAGLVLYFLGRLIAKALDAPEPFFKGWMILFAICGAIVFINFLLSLIGHGFISL